MQAMGGGFEVNGSGSVPIHRVVPKCPSMGSIFTTSDKCEYLPMTKPTHSIDLLQIRLKGLPKVEKMRKYQDCKIFRSVLIMDYTIAQTLSSENFKRRFGIHLTTFKQMVEALTPLWRPLPKPGVKPKLTLEDRILMALEYWREYRTYFHIGSSWGISESTVCRIIHWVEDALMQSGCFRLPSKKRLVQGFSRPTVVVIDPTFRTLTVTVNY